MKRSLFPSIFSAVIFGAVLFATPAMLHAQIPLTPSDTPAADPLGPPNTRKGYYVKDGETHRVWILRQDKADNAVSFVLPPQEGYPETVIFMPDQISEWGFEDDKTHYIGTRVETEEGVGLYFMEETKVKTGDGTRIAYLSDKVLPVDTYFRVAEDGAAIESGTERHAAPMLDYFASVTGYRSSDPDLKYPGKLRRPALDRYYDAFADRNDKLFPQRRFGVTIGGGPVMPKMLQHIPTIASDYRITSPDMGFSFSAGVFARIPIDGALSFQPELLYSYISTSADFKYRDFDFDKARFSMSSVRVPLLLRMNILRGESNWSFYAEAGPEADMNFGSYRYNSLDLDPSNGRFIAGPRKKTDLSPIACGFAAGLGIEHYINARQAAWLGVRFSRVSNRWFTHRNRYAINHIELVAAFSLFNF